MTSFRLSSLFIAVALCATSSAHAAYTKVSDVIAGGGWSSSGSYTLSGTVGQPVVGLVTGDDYSNHSGFWNIRTGDTIPPAVSGFALESPFRSRTVPFQVPITSLSAGDTGSSVTGYYFSSSSTKPTEAWGTGWNVPTPASLQLAAKGPQTYYVWVRDAAGNISTDIVPASTTTILQYLLETSIAGSGGQSITSSPNGIGCSAGTPGSCSALFDENQAVALTGNPDLKSELTAWSGSSTGSSNPVAITMDADKTVTGNFALVTSPARIVYGKGYATLTEILQNLAANSSLETRWDTYPSTQSENLLFNNGYTVTLSGGKDSNWNATNNLTTVKGTLKISNGNLTVQGIRLKP